MGSDEFSPYFIHLTNIYGLILIVCIIPVKTGFQTLYMQISYTPPNKTRKKALVSQERKNVPKATERVGRTASMHALVFGSKTHVLSHITYVLS